MPDDYGQQGQGQQSGMQQQGQSRADRIYESEDIIIKAKMLESEFQDRVFSIVEAMPLSMGTKLALGGLIAMAFDKNVVLANNPDIDIRCLRFEEALNKAKLTFTRPDVMTQALPGMLENLRQAFRDFVSRSLNMNERKMQGERKTVVTQNLGGQDQSAPGIQPSRKHGFDLVKEKLNL
jgi:hypothetical protein